MSNPAPHVHTVSDVPSENGWNPSRATPDQCEWIRVPGAEHVSLQFLRGQPLTILRAFAADYHAYIEPLRDPDSAAWTPTNSVPTSNHLNGTGMDLNWQGADGKTFRLGISKERAYPGNKAQELDALLDWYEKTVYCGGYWNIRDWMHFQMGYDTFNNPRTADFISRKIRPDGFSTYRRGGDGVTTPVPNRALDVAGKALAPASVTRSRLESLLPELVRSLELCGADTVARRAMWFAQIGHESAGLRYQEEIASGAAYEGRCRDLGNCYPGDGVRFKGRDFVQVTGRGNYTELSEWAFDQGLVPSRTFFVDHPEKLATDEYAFLGVTWYWTTQRPMNDAADAQDLERATRYINGGLNGIADRRTRYSTALALGYQLMEIDSEQHTTIEELLMSDKLYPSLSIYKTPGSGAVHTLAALIQAIDARAHEDHVEKLARQGNAAALALVARTAAGKGEFTDPSSVEQAMSVLADIGGKTIEEIREMLGEG